jgi:LmbE family N-acetylglucosaminyl deacetylase
VPFAVAVGEPVMVAAPELGEVAWRQALLDLGNDLRLMCVAAHPDDEDGATLAYHRFKYGVETHVAIATRGEGGQNEIGPELYEELAVIRTKEMEAAAAIEGAILHWLNLPDFGFSKAKEEAYAFWGEEEALRRMVRLIREVRPHVIITHHGRQLDHGHHQAIGDALLRAFEAAAHPSQFPGEGEPWQVARLYIRAWVAPQPESVAIPIGELNPLRGKTYAEIAAHALEVHYSQGMGYFIERLLEMPVIHYDLVKSAETAMQGEPMDNAAGPLFAGIPGLRLERPLPLDSTREHALAARLGGGGFLAAAAQRRFRVTVDDGIAVPGQELAVSITSENFGAGPDSPFSFHIEPGTVAVVGEGTSNPLRITLLPDATPTLPSVAQVYQDHFRRPALEAVVRVDDTPGEALRIPLHLDIAPPVGIEFIGAPYLIRTQAGHTVRADVRLTNFAPRAQDAVFHLDLPPGWSAEPSSAEVSFRREDEVRVVSFEVTAPVDAAPGGSEITGRVANVSQTARASIRVVDLALPVDIHAGVVETYDDTFVRTLERLGISHARINEAGFAPADLDAFDVIVLDMRAYMARPDLVTSNAAVLGYVARGGTLLVMYHKTFEWQPEFAPYPITLSNNRVTREDAPVTLLEPHHPVWNVPNTIGPRDWENWRQERGLYFAEAWHPAYTPLAATADPGEEIPPGSMLIAHYGEGIYLYTALGWYRQLRELHPGALRVFANMLAL